MHITLRPSSLRTRRHISAVKPTTTSACVVMHGERYGSRSARLKNFALLTVTVRICLTRAEREDTTMHHTSGGNTGTKRKGGRNGEDGDRAGLRLWRFASFRIKFGYGPLLR
ncbi:hypothetical protein Trydic_g9314 [Trypoxylus dichotomus]